MSNSFRFDITDDDGLKETMELAFRKHPKGASGWAVIDGALVFAWGDNTSSDSPFTAFPTGIGSWMAADLAKEWLESQEYGPETGWDGSHSKGYRVYNEAYGHAGGDYRGFVAIKPHWIVYGK